MLKSGLLFKCHHWPRDMCCVFVGAVSARIAGFSTMFHAQLHDTAVLPCAAVGKPDPRVTWKKQSVHGQLTILYRSQNFEYSLTQSLSSCR